MAIIADNIAQVRERIARACALAERPVESVTLLAVTKRFGPEAAREALACGEHRFGENYVLEGVEKIEALALLRERLEWHLIGPLQSNKTRIAAERFDWVQSIDRLRIAQRLSEQRPAGLPPLQVCVQVNISGEASKSGVPDAALALAHEVARLPRLVLRGLMAIPQPASEPAGDSREPYRALRELLHDLKSDGLDVDTLSIGMSDDLEAAIAEGATLLRIGSAIFGPRRAST